MTSKYPSGFGVELLKALYRHARLLILDEPTAVLTPLEVDEFFAILRRMREQGKTVIIITHKLEEVRAISEDVRDDVHEVRVYRNFLVHERDDQEPPAGVAIDVARRRLNIAPNILSSPRPPIDQDLVVRT